MLKRLNKKSCYFLIHVIYAIQHKQDIHIALKQAEHLQLFMDLFYGFNEKTFECLNEA